MEMQSWSFMLFVLISVLLYWFVVPQRFRPHFLLAISIGYYFTVSFVFAIFLLIYLYAMYVIGILIDTAEKKRGRVTWLVVGIVVAIGILFVFKARAGLIQIAFFALGLGGGKMAAALAAKIGIPLGISYFSFRVIHYLVEVYRGKQLRATPLEFFLYITFFPTMVSGPIHRFYTIRREKPEDSFGNQLRGEGGSPPLKFDDFSYGIWRILQGVVKKFVIADFFLKLAGPMMTKMGLAPSVGTLELWVAAHAWFAYLYLDFSGYSDMAIGLARLFGFRVMENFNWGVLGHNLQDFWRRWHISLTYWVTNYVYIPLGGSRKSEVRTDFNALVTIVVIALWHNINFNMLIWGIFEGVGLIVFRHYAQLKRRLLPDHKPTWWGKVIGIIMVWTFHGISWPLFHHPVHIAAIYYLKMFPFLTGLFPILRSLLSVGG